jgi:hypothetical protein
VAAVGGTTLVLGSEAISRRTADERYPIDQ